MSNNADKLAFIDKLVKEWHQYCNANNLADPEEEDFVDFANEHGYKDVAMELAVKNLYMTKRGQAAADKKAATEKAAKKKVEKPSSLTKNEPSDDDLFSDESEMTPSQIHVLNKIKDIVRGKMTPQQRIDLRRYLENE